MEDPELYFTENNMWFETVISSKTKQERRERMECLICLQFKMCITQPRCEHFICIDWFRRCYYTDININNEPTFPYDKNITPLDIIIKKNQNGH